ncbi:MAG: hypothetical protein CME17_03920 [Gemmatimonadetes bacterium]|nr:hypothetical protein [Gemmatimonadota bacterium]
MPRYEYRCTKCEKTMIIWHSMSDDSHRTCEQCSTNLEKIISDSNWGPSRFQTQAVLTNGQRIDGHFGRIARTNRNKWG